VFAAACGDSPPSARPPSEPAALPAATRDATFDAAVASIAARRTTLARAYAAAPDDRARAAVRADARAFLIEAITSDLFPLWLGMPWGLGSNSTATRPHEPGMKVGCSYFVTAILGNAGFRLSNRYTFARAPALDIQRSLARDKSDIHRYLSIPADDLESRIAALGDGLWLIGLNNHIAWVVVHDGAVRLVHASGVDRVVIDEPFAPSPVIDFSRRAGYFVSPVIVASPTNDALIDAWLRGETVEFRGS
jgi:hypothetical protein